uniref:DinB-like domain-containing protein n=1 Tax=Solibacter usitatus (strain Ellin6076) TaxID=234267 RepID=Q01VA5_SOLUE
MTCSRGVFLLAATAVLLPAQTISDKDRNAAVNGLRSSSTLFLRAIEGVSEAQWNFKAAPERWSIAECAEHLAVTDSVMLDWIRKIVAQPAAGMEHVFYEAVLVKSVDRSRKDKAPRSIAPTGRWQTPAEVMDAFRKHREQTIAYVQTTKDDLRSHLTASKTEPLDAFQLVLTITGHTERHVAQINEVKGSLGYPR